MDPHTELIQSIMSELGTKTFYEILLIRNKLVQVLTKLAFQGDEQASQLLFKVDTLTSIEQVAWIYHDRPKLRNHLIENPFSL